MQKRDQLNTRGGRNRNLEELADAYRLLTHDETRVVVITEISEHSALERTNGSTLRQWQLKGKNG